MKIGTTRVETFSDGVLAIIITIMVLAFKLPEFDKEETGRSIQKSLTDMLPYFATYSFSFLMIGIFWLNHHHMFHLLENTDEKLLIQNLMFLFFASLIPLATAVVGSAPLVSESVAFYGFVMLMTTFSLSIMRSYAIRQKLLVTSKQREKTNMVYRVSLRARTKSIIGTLAYLCSVPMAFVSVYISFAFFLLPPVLFFIPEGIDDEKLAEDLAEKSGADKIEPES